jgi:hypothetical protein
MSEEITPTTPITPANAVEVYRKAFAQEDSPDLLEALVARVKELEKQRDAAVYILRAAQGPQLVRHWVRTAQLDVGVSDALVALGAEETK